MKKNIFAVILAACFLFPAFAQAETDSTAQEKSPAVQINDNFSHLFVFVEGGEIYPFGDLIDAVDNALYGGIGVRYSYWGNFDGFVKFDYSYFTPHSDDTKIYGAHQFSGKVGIDYRAPFLRPVVVGAGFVCNWVRADYDEDEIDEHSFKEDLGGTLTDNETEFGWFARLNLPVTRRENYNIGINILWEELWTLPERSDMLSAGIYFERKIW